MKKQLLFLATGLLLSVASYGQYCTTGLYGSACSFGDDLNSFSFATIANTNTGCGGTGGYNDFTSMSATLVPGVTYNWSASSNYTCCEYFAIWIDYNNDNDFNDAGEQIYTSPSTGFAWSGTYSTPIIPGTFRLRARVAYYGYMGATSACTYFSYGETEDYTITILPPAFSAQVSSPIDLACYGDSTATLSANIFFGTAPYTYAWSNGSTDSAQFNMPVGTYTLTVTDSVGDTTSASIVVAQPDSISLSTSILTSLVCDYDISHAQAVGAGGVAFTGYIIDTTSANFGPDSSMPGTVVTIPGNYASSNALDIGFDFVYFGDTVSSFKCNSEGFLTFEPSWSSGWTADHAIPSTNGPAGVIAFGWENFAPLNGGEVNYYTMGTAPFRTLVVNYFEVPYEFGNPAVDYMTVQVQLHETSNCIEIHSTTVGNSVQAGSAVQGIENLAENEAYWVPGRNYQGWSATNDYVRFCPADSSGLYYEWSDGSVGADAYGLPAGTYTVSATDQNGCVNTNEVTVDPGVSALVSALDAADVSCFGFDDASIDPGIAGGVNPVSYTWTNGATTATLSNLEPGTYSVSAEDAVGCTIEVNNVTVMEPAILLGSVYEVGNAICSNDENGSASIVVSGGVPPYTPLWSNGEIAYTATQLPSGGNYVQITDANGCEAFLTVNVLYDFESPTPDIGNNFINPTGAGVTLSTQPNTYSSYLWNTGATTPTMLAALTGIYWVEVSNDAGCTGSDTAYVEVWPTGVSEVSELVGVTMYPNPARDMINFNISSDINMLNVAIVDVKGATVAQTQFNNSGVQSISLENLSAGIYSVQLSTEEGQVSTQKLVVTK